MLRSDEELVGKALAGEVSAFIALTANLSVIRWIVPGRLALGQPSGWPLV